LELKSNTDALTSLKNRRYFDKILEAEVHKAKSKNIPLSLIMFDIDRFKNINDTYGHQVGDEALRGLAKTVSAHIRQSDVLARYGGEEFAVIASWTNIDAAKILAEKLRKTIEELKLPDVPQFTCSFGVAQMEEEDFTHDIIKRADDALYEAKNSGRNIVIAKGESR
jgi:diguanylate cyclase (GGDEF)-like protein